jgi:hypothetical protein
VLRPKSLFLSNLIFVSVVCHPCTGLKYFVSIWPTLFISGVCLHSTTDRRSKLYKSSSYDTANVSSIHDKDQISGQCHYLLLECYKTWAHCLRTITGLYFCRRWFILMFITEIHRVKYRSYSKQNSWHVFKLFISKFFLWVKCSSQSPSLIPMPISL